MNTHLTFVLHTPDLSLTSFKNTLLNAVMLPITRDLDCLFSKQIFPPSRRSCKPETKAALMRCFNLFWLCNIHSWLHFPNCFILTLRIFRPLNDSRSLKDDLPAIVLFLSSAVTRKATTRMSFRWENCVCRTSPPALSLPKVSCQLTNHLCPVLSAKKTHFHFGFKEDKAECTGIMASVGMTYVTWRKDPTARAIL